MPRANGRLPIIPRPKQVTSGPLDNAFRLTPRTRLIVRDGATAEDRRGAVLLQGEIKRRFGFAPPIIAARAAGSLDGAIALGEPMWAGGGPLKAALARAEPPPKPEGYALSVSPRTVVIAGNDAAGTLWGAQTAIQLLDADAKGPMFLPVTVHDWPSLALRGVHLFHGHNALPFHQKLVDRVLSRFKMNAVFLQAEQVRWNTDPTVAPAWAGTPDQIKAEIAFARARGITVYPLIQGYGHMEWLFSKTGNRDFAEDPEKPYAVNFTNPAAVAYLDRFVREADDLFGAPGFHMGLDEVDITGRFPYRSAPRTLPDLYIAAVRHWHDLLAARGKTMWMWADMALGRDEVKPSWGTTRRTADAAAIRAGVPKDVVMVDWQYSPRASYPSLRVLKEAGFTRLVAGTWNADGIQPFTRAAARAGALGAIQTTWAGYESRESVLATPDLAQFVAMVLAADYFWNGGEGPGMKNLPYDPAAVFARQWGDAPTPSG